LQRILLCRDAKVASASSDNRTKVAIEKTRTKIFEKLDWVRARKHLSGSREIYERFPI
jgi:hypothetical protein